MNKYLLIPVLAISVFMAGCSAKTESTAETDTKAVETSEEENKESEPVASDVQEEEQEEIKEVTADDLVGLMYDMSGTTKVCYDAGNPDSVYEFMYEIKIPEITDGSQAAKSINYEINHMYADTVKRIEDLVKNNGEEELYEPEYSDIGYKAYVNGDVLSIIIDAHEAYIEWTTYAIFNYDYVKQEVLKDADMLSLCGLTEDELNAACKNTVEKAQADNFTRMMESYSGEDDFEIDFYSSMLPDMIRMHYDALHDENNDGSMGIFFNEEGKLTMCGYEYVPAGGGLYAELMEVDLSGKPVDTSVYKKYYEEYKFPGVEYRIIGLYDGEGLNYDRTVKNGNSENQITYYMGYDMENPEALYYQYYNTDEGEGISYQGALTFESVDEDGFTYSYEFKAVDEVKGGKNTLKGKFRAVPHNNYDEAADEYDDNVSLFYIEGDELFDMDGEEVVLYRSVG